MRKRLKDLFFDAQDFLEEGDTDLAIKTYQIALEYAKKDDAEEFLALIYLAMAFDDADDQAKSTEYCKRAQQLAARVFGEKSLEFATALSNEGMIYSNRDRLRMAEPLLDQATSTLKSLGKSARSKKAHQVAEREVEVYSNAADCKARLGKMPEAIDLFTRAHQSAKATLPQNHPIRLRAAMDLSVVLDASGQGARAKKFRFEAMDGLINEDLNPMFAMSLFVEAAANACGLLEILESADLSTSSNRSKRTNKTVSNVVPLHPKQTARSKAEAPKESCAAYQLKISLKGVKPPIWRRVVILASLSLAELHSSIQEAMGWADSHLHEFRIRNSRFGNKKQMDDVKDERTFDLADFNFKVGSKLDYLYDFGDGWHHVIEVEKLLTKEEFEASDVFVTGKGACPPEDCGGPYGFMHLLAALKDPDAQAQLPEWLEEYDPNQLPDCFPVTKKKKSVTRSPSASRP